MTKKEALTIAINTLSAEEFAEVRETLTNMIDKLSVSHPMTEEAKARRKAQTAAVRSALVNAVTPILRGHMSHVVEMTAKEIFSAAQTELPIDFSAAKVQNILLREMAPELVKTEAKGKPNTYRLK